MTLKKSVLVMALLVTPELFFWRCTNQEYYDYQITKSVESAETYKISQYDSIMQKAVTDTELDWRFLAAIGYHESRFLNDVVSPVGAIGVMQIMPAVAKCFGVSVEEVKKPEVNIETAVKIIKTIEKSMKFPKNASREDRLKIILASYNGGIGHVMDARRLAAKNGASGIRWEDVEKFLQLKGSPEFVKDEVVKCGSFKATQTVSFVKQVMQQYNRYCNKFPS